MCHTFIPHDVTVNVGKTGDLVAVAYKWMRPRNHGVVGVVQSDFVQRKYGVVTDPTLHGFHFFCCEDHAKNHSMSSVYSNGTKLYKVMVHPELISGSGHSRCFYLLKDGEDMEQAALNFVSHPKVKKLLEKVRAKRVNRKVLHLQKV